MRHFIIATLIGAFMATSAAADPAVEKGTEIARKSDATDVGWRTSAVSLTMTLINPNGQSTQRRLKFESLEKTEEGAGDKTLVTFESPADVRGTVLLSHARILDSDNQWLFLPQMRQIRRISSANKSGPFVGSEFAFEDLTGGEFGKYNYRYIETKTLDGMPMHVVECTPRYERSGYTRILCYYDTEHLQARRFEFFNRGNRLLKTLELKQYQRYPAGFWRSHEQVMTNHLTGRSTVLKFEPYVFGLALSTADFTPEALERR